MYTDYEFYKNKYFGELVREEEFPKYELKSRDELDYYTRMRIPYLKDEKKLNKVKMCECKIIDLMFYRDEEIKRIREYESKTVQGVITSETVGKQSVSYQKAIIRDIKTVDDELAEKIAKIIRKDLAMTGLLYRGVNCV